MELIDFLKEASTGIKYNKKEVKDKLDGLAKAQPELAAQVNDFEGWLVSKMEG